MRPATPSDAPQMVEMYETYFHENQKIMPMRVVFDRQMTTDFINRVLNHSDQISFVSDDGMILGEVAHTWFGPNSIAHGGVWYVRPGARNGILARSLLRAFDREAERRGAVYSRAEFDNPAHFKVVDGLYKLAGYRDYSKIYVKEFK